MYTKESNISLYIVPRNSVSQLYSTAIFFSSCWFNHIYFSLQHWLDFDKEYNLTAASMNNVDTPTWLTSFPCLNTRAVECGDDLIDKLGNIYRDLSQYLHNGTTEITKTLAWMVSLCIGIYIQYNPNKKEEC
jgi:hypothetical protein